MASKQLSSNDLKMIPKDFILGWIAGYRALLKEERQRDSHNIPNNPLEPITNIRTAATVSYYSGAERVLADFERVLSGQASG